MVNTGKGSVFSVAASYRDPRARVYEYDGVILRAISETGLMDYQHTLRCGFYHHAGKLPVGHESLYLHICVDKVHGSTLWKSLSC